MNLGLLGFLVGLIADQAVLKRIFTPLMGVALIVAVVVFLRPRQVAPSG